MSRHSGNGKDPAQERQAQSYLILGAGGCVTIKKQFGRKQTRSVERRKESNFVVDPFAMHEEMEVIHGAESMVMMAPGTVKINVQGEPPLFHVRRLRNLAVASIICGCSCIGVMALIYAVKANEKQKAGFQQKALFWAQKSRFMACLSIGVWLSILILTPLFFVLMCYILSQAE